MESHTKIKTTTTNTKEDQRTAEITKKQMNSQHRTRVNTKTKIQNLNWIQTPQKHAHTDQNTILQ